MQIFAIYIFIIDQQHMQCCAHEILYNVHVMYVHVVIFSNYTVQWISFEIVIQLMYQLSRFKYYSLLKDTALDTVMIMGMWPFCV